MDKTTEETGFITTQQRVYRLDLLVQNPEQLPWSNRSYAEVCIS